MYPRVAKTSLQAILSEQIKEVELENDLVLTSKVKTLLMDDVKEFVKVNKKLTKKRNTSVSTRKKITKLKRPKKPIRKKKKKRK